MNDTLTRYLNTCLLPERAAKQLLTVLTPVFDQFSTRALTNSTLVQSATTTKVKTGAADSYFVVQGIPVKIAAGVDMAVLSGVIDDANTNVFCFYSDSANGYTSAMGTQAATLAGVKFPPQPQGKVLVGFVIITCSGGAFTGGSSNVATAGNFTVVFISPVGPFDPSVLV